MRSARARAVVVGFFLAVGAAPAMANTAPDPARDWIVPTVSVVGTLLGVLFGAAGSWLIHRSQLNHEEKTRFHERRLESYGRFSAAANEIFAWLLTNPDDFNARQGSMATLIREFGLIRLIASKDVSLAAATLHGHVGQAVRADTQQELARVFVDFNLSATRFVEAARLELGVGAMEITREEGADFLQAAFPEVAEAMRREGDGDERPD